MASGAGAIDVATIRKRARQRFRDWVNRRIPPAREVTLNQKRLFIFPSRVGLFFVLCLSFEPCDSIQSNSLVHLQ